MSGTRNGIAQIHRTPTPNKAPTANTLLDGELAVEQADPMKLWVGVPTTIDPTGQKLLFDATKYLPLTGGTLTGPLTVGAGATFPHLSRLTFESSNASQLRFSSYVDGTIGMEAISVAGARTRLFIVSPNSAPPSVIFYVAISSPSVASPTLTNGPGGNISVGPQDIIGGGNGNGGNVAIRAGAAGTQPIDVGGSVTITAGTSSAGPPGNIIMTGLPTTAPAVSGALWINAGVLNIVP